jgi:hypothetical protein
MVSQKKVANVIVEEGKLSDFRPAKRNHNRHTAKGMSALESSMHDDGYVSPMTAAQDGEMLVGSARLEKAFELFPDKAIIIKHDGTVPLIAVRTDVEDGESETGRRIQYRDNLVGWMDFDPDAEVLVQDIESGFDFQGLGVNLKELGVLLDKSVSDMLAELPDLEFSPEVNPGAANVVYDESDVAQAQTQMQSKFGPGQSDQIELICPHCLKSLFVNRTEISP